MLIILLRAMPKQEMLRYEYIATNRIYVQPIHRVYNERNVKPLATTKKKQIYNKRHLR